MAVPHESEVPREATGWLDCQLIVFAALAPLPVAAAFLSRAPLLIIVVALPALAMLHWHVRRHGGWRLIGPHAYYDLVRMARQGRTTLFRVAFLLVVLGGIWYTYEYPNSGGPLGVVEENGFRLRPRNQRHQNTREELARFNTQCAYTWLLLQDLAILLLTPAYVGGAIAEERERGTLALLFTSALYDREIVLGKLLARLVHLGAFLLAGLPILSLMLVWGGIDMPFLLAHWLGSMFLLLTACSVSLMISTMPIGATRCVIVAYAVVLPVGGCCISIWSSAVQEAFFRGAGLAEPGLHVLFAVTFCLVIPGCLLLTVYALRPVEAPAVVYFPLAPQRTKADAAPEPQAHATVVRLSPHQLRIQFDAPPPVLPRVTDGGLLWKERYTGGRSPWQTPELMLMGSVLLGWCFTLLLCGSIGQALNPRPDNFDDFLRRCAELWQAPLRIVYGATLMIFAIGVAVRAAGSVVRERQQQTLDMLLMIPVDRVEILRAKWLGAIVKGWPWLAILCGDLATGLAVGAYHPYSAACLLVAPWPLLACLCSIGLLVSVLARTVVQANLVMAGALVAVTATLWWLQPGVYFGISSLNFSWWDSAPVVMEELAFLCAAAALLLLLAAAAWLASRLSFDRPINAAAQGQGGPHAPRAESARGACGPPCS